MNFFAPTKIGKKRSFTPEGFLLIEDVPIGRVGDLVYGATEIPLTPGRDGLIRVSRTADELFAPNTLSSFQGKAVTIGHPPVDVCPDNWQTYAKGDAINPRRGTGDESDLMLADILIKDRRTIDAVQRGNVSVEVSAGYNSDYEELGPGLARQSKIIGNHVALLIGGRGRCGPRCSFGDHHHDQSQQESTMKKKGFIDAIRSAFRTNDEAALDEVLDAADGNEDGETHVHIYQEPPTRLIPPTLSAARTADCVGDDMPAWFKAHVESNNARFDAMEAMVMTLQPANVRTGDAAVAQKPEEKMRELFAGEVAADRIDAAVRTTDSSFLDETFSETASLAEILTPGIRIPTYDRAMPAEESLGALNHLRRSALEVAYNTQPETRSVIETTLSGKAFRTTDMLPGELRQLFKAAAASRKALNNRSFHDSAAAHHTTTPRGAGSLAEVNRRSAEFWKTH